ncbi:hypothetical protein CBM2598_U60007 [Cupriavidus taiwanensis]|uniref:Uncharacterized protein n=1 Tax=Cupriavidus taiwanensis TaxID=164546 RepID=A0A7Z7JGI4_9BURK|nr:hypothetical protein CBM2597_U60025 [Cupriavidus taiwanensis]SOZ97284.1 hypothetical protein CBM2598_U60007 [Cupriavidus taiwanensis]SPC26172.1 hypothetical protein CBM2594_U70005 [Cupriavidus taiwanensis]
MTHPPDNILELIRYPYRLQALVLRR